MHESNPSSVAGRSAAGLWTIGHSTRSWEEFTELLRSFRIGVLADVRRFPASRRHPQFHREHLAAALPERNIRYVWFESLGGRRGGGAVDESLYGGLRNTSFRAYAAYMETPAFTAAVDDLLSIAAETPTAIMCAEAVYWRCHRRLISDHLLARGIKVEHIMSPDRSSPHRLTESAVIHDGRVIYPPPLFAPSVHHENTKNTKKK